MPPNRARGFTLLEVIAALAILGIAVGVMMQIFSGGLKNIHRIDMAHRAMHHAENVMNQVLDTTLRRSGRGVLLCCRSRLLGGTGGDLAP